MPCALSTQTSVNFSFHAVTIRNTLSRRQPNTRQKEPRTMSTTHGQPEHKARAVRTSAEERATLPESGADAPTDRERRRGSPKPSPDQKSRRPRRAGPRRNADRMQSQPEQTTHRTPYTEPERIAPTCRAGQKLTERPQNTLEATQSSFC